jgi:hypothetical protein
MPMLTQIEADDLISTPKRFISSNPISIPPGEDESHELISHDNREKFLLDVWRGTIRLSKVKLQARAQTIYVLVRLDIDGAPHTNPDGVKIGGTHLHLYREGYGDKWATVVDPKTFQNLSSVKQAFEDFLHFCNITESPAFQEYIQ